MMSLAINGDASSQAQAITFHHVDELGKWMEAQLKSEKDESQIAHLKNGIFLINNFKNDPGDFKLPDAPTAPAGSPIGTDEFCSWN